MKKLEHYISLIAALGFWQFLLYKLQGLRVSCFKIQSPLFLCSRYARYPLKYRPLASDQSVFSQIFISHEYRHLDGVPDVKLVIDCGANVGYSSAYFLSRFPGCHVIAIEPDPGNISLLRENLAPYKERCHVVQSALWSEQVGLALSEDFGLGNEWSRHVVKVNPGEEAIMVSTDIGTLLKDSGYDRISILKIDIEGAEAIVFASNYEHWIKKVDNLAIELHNDECAAIFQKAVSSQNFSISRCGELTICKRL